MGFAALTCALLALPPGQEPAPRLAVIRPAPDFTLTDQDGKEVRASDLRGKVLLVSFIFTTCNGTCPATTHRMAKVRQLVTDKDVVFLSITLDPARDKPEVLRNYIRLYDLDVSRWHFLTGPPEMVAKVIEAWGMWAKPAPNGQLDHPSRIFLVDRKQRVREIYNVDLLRPADVAEDIAELRKER
jgi:protein SCO1/2